MTYIDLMTSLGYQIDVTGNAVGGFDGFICACTDMDGGAFVDYQGRIKYLFAPWPVDILGPKDNFAGFGAYNRFGVPLFIACGQSQSPNVAPPTDIPIPTPDVPPVATPPVEPFDVPLSPPPPVGSVRDILDVPGAVPPGGAPQPMLCPASPIQVNIHVPPCPAPDGLGQAQSGRNAVGLDQPAAYRWEQRQQPWFRDAVAWMPQPEQDFINSGSFADYAEAFRQRLQQEPPDTLPLP